MSFANTFAEIQYHKARQSANSVSVEHESVLKARPHTSIGICEQVSAQTSPEHQDNSSKTHARRTIRPVGILHHTPNIHQHPRVRHRDIK